MPHLLSVANAKEAGFNLTSEEPVPTDVELLGFDWDHKASKPLDLFKMRKTICGAALSEGYRPVEKTIEDVVSQQKPFEQEC